MLNKTLQDLKWDNSKRNKTVKLLPWNLRNSVICSHFTVCETLTKVTSFPPPCQLCVERGIVYQSGEKKLCITHIRDCWMVFLCAFITTPCIFSNIFKLIFLPISFNYIG